jgi:hypothetical protein
VEGSSRRLFKDLRHKVFGETEETSETSQKYSRIENLSRKRANTKQR